jgi:TolB-like protein
MSNITKGLRCLLLVIAAQLLGATTGAYLRAEQYKPAFCDIFPLQDEIVQRIVTMKLAVLEK